MAQVFLGLGANTGDRLSNLEVAIAALATLGPVRRSGWYETEPVNMTGAPSFLNGVISMETSKRPLELLDWILALEQELGRDPESERNPGGRNPAGYRSRSIDIDMLLYGQQVIEEPRLRVPHVRMHERAFVLVPLAELAPEAVHPVLGKTAAEMLKNVDSSGVVAYIEQNQVGR